MSAGSAQILCICCQKTLVLGDREEAQRQQIEKLRAAVTASGLSGSSVVLPGGCIVAQGASICEHAGYASAVAGRIDNRRALVERYLRSEDSPQNSPGKTNISDAELVCHLYKLYGRSLPQKLKGDFSLVLYDSTQGRVLAITSPGSSKPLVQARSADHSLVITTKQPAELSAGAYDIIPIPSGYLKYGWTSEPQRYAASREFSRQSSQAIAVAAAAQALAGVSTGAEPSSSASTTTPLSTAVALDGEAESPASAPKKTRRGKRAGKNQKLRAEQQMQQRMSLDSRRASMDISLAGSLQSVSSLCSRADEHNWWRTNTPRTSLDIRPLGSRTGSERLSFESRRSTMSHAAAPFVPGQGYFLRQSVPAVIAQHSALSFTGPELGRTILTATDTPAAERSPFENTATESPGKADAAWEEEPQEAVHPAPQAAAPEKQAAVAPGKDAPVASAEEPQPLPSPLLPAELPADVAPAAPEAVTRLQQEGDVGGRSGVVGASPHRPPRAPSSNFKQFFRAMMAKRPSQTDLTAEAGSAAAKRRGGRSSSHNNLVDLDTPSGLWDAPIRLHGAKTLPPTPANSREASGDLSAAIGRAALAEAGRALGRRPESWLSRKTRSIFKSKSCTNLADAEPLPKLPGDILQVVS